EARAAEIDARGGGKALSAVIDVRDPVTLEAAVDRALTTFGSLDLLVANAGVGGYRPIDELDSETWHRIIDTNLSGVFNSVKAAIPALKESHGMIVTIGSLAGTNFFPGGAASNASKLGLLGLSPAITLDLRDHRTRAPSTTPGSALPGCH